MTKRRVKKIELPPPYKDEFPEWPNIRTRPAPCCGQPVEYLQDSLKSKADGPDAFVGISVCCHCGAALLIESDVAMTLRVCTAEAFQALSDEAKLELVKMGIEVRTNPQLRKRAAQLRAAVHAAEREAMSDASNASPIFLTFTRGPTGKQ